MYYQMMPNQRIQYVNGIESAKMYQMGTNSEQILMDSKEPIFYLKATDASGMSTIKEYEFKERIVKDEAKKEIDEIKDRIAKIEFAINSIKEANYEPNLSAKSEHNAKSIQSVQENNQGRS